MIAGEKDGSPWVERLVAAAVIIFLTLINLAGVKVRVIFIYRISPPSLLP